MTAYVLAGLSQAQAAGFEVKQEAIDKASRLAASGVRQDAEGQDRSAGLHGIRAGESGVHDTAVLDSVWAQRSTLTPYGQAILGLAMLDMNDARAQRA